MTNRTCLNFAALALLLATTTTARAAEGDFSWALDIGGTGSESPGGIAVDDFGNVYIAGHFEGTVDFDPGPGVTELTSSAGEDASIFVAKYSPAGGLIWARTMGGTIFSTGQDIAVDAQGNVFITGWFNQTADLDPGPGEFIVNSPNFGDIFVVKLNTNGIFEWAYALSNEASSLAYTIALDDAGNVYAAGKFTGTVEFDPGPGSAELIGLGSGDIFVVKLDPAGNLVWARGMGGMGNNEARALAVDATGNVYIGAWFTETADLNPGEGTFSRESNGILDIAVIKLNASGNFVWAKAMGGSGREELQGLAIDDAGNVLVTGLFNSFVNFDPDITNIQLTSTDGSDAFVVKIDSNSNLLWARALGVPSSSRGFGITVDKEGNVFTAGDFEGTSDFDPGPGTFNLTSAGSKDIFISKLTTNGNFVWAKSVGGPGFNRSAGIALDSLGAVHVIGRFVETVDMNPGIGQFNLTSAGSGDVFLLKLKGEDDSPPVGLSGRITDALTDAPLSCAAVEVYDPDALEEAIVAVTDNNGAYFFEPLPAGAYEVRVLAPAYTTLTPPLLTLGPDEKRTADFALEPRAAVPVIAGRVTDAETGQPLVWVLARLFINGDFVTDSYTCGSGFYELPLPFAKDGEEVDIEVEFSLPNFETETVEDSIDPELGGTVDTALKKSVIGLTFLAGSVSGRIGSESTPLEDARITLRGPVNASTQSNAEGLYSFETLIDGSYTVTAGADGFLGKSVVRNLSPGTGDQAVFELLTEPEIVADPSDVNNDGTVNAVDVQLVINAALGIAIDPSFDADINGDGSINAVDVQLVINAALGIGAG